MVPVPPFTSYKGWDRSRSPVSECGRQILSQCLGYWPSQLTRLFQSTNEPCGFSRQAQTWSSKNEGMLKRFGAATKLKTCPSSTGGVLLLAASQVAASKINSTPTSLIFPPDGS